MKMSKLLALALVLLISVGTLAGSTIAWFTDEVTSANNIIKSGTLDVAMEYKNPKDTNWADASEGAIFSHQNWEPGYTDLKQVKVINKGSLAFEFMLNILPDAAVADNNKLAGVIDVYVGTGAAPASFADVQANAMNKDKVATISELMSDTDGAAYGVLLPEGETAAGVPTKEVEMWIALHMQESAGNEYQNLSIGNGFSLQLLAKQFTYEGDSFGIDYDAEAHYAWDADVPRIEDLPVEVDGTITITTAEQLAALALSVNNGTSYSGKTIKLGNDINLAGREWTPIGTTEHPFTGIFDGQGYTISNLKINEPDMAEVGLFGRATNSTIQNIKVKNVNVVGYQEVAAIVGSPYSGCTISNCHVSGNINIVANYAYAGGIAAYGYVDIDNCSVIAEGTGKITAIDRNAVGGICAWVLENNNSVTNCQVKNLDLTGWTNVGSITGFLHYNNIMSGCTAENITLTKTRADGIPAIGLATGGWCYGDGKTISITNNTFKNITLNGQAVPYAIPDEVALYCGGEYYGKTDTSGFVLNNNSTDNITDNIIHGVKAVKTADALVEALTEGGRVVLSENVELNANNTVTVAAGKEVTLDLNGNTISSTADKTGNQELFLVKGTMNVSNGTVTVKAENNQSWNAMNTAFDVTAGGVLNIKDATIINEGGTDMGFCVHLNNWGEVTLNIENSVLKSNYIAVRAFNSGNHMNNITIKNSTLEGKYDFWVHNYTLADFGGDAAKQEAHAKLLNLDIYGNNNTFNYTGKAPVLYGFTDTIYFDANGNKVA